MGTIQNKRASGRGVPPDVVAGFMPIGGKETPEQENAVREVVTWFLAIIFGMFVLGLLTRFFAGEDFY